MKQAKVITFEGIDGSGKTALLKLLYERLCDKYPVHHIDEFCPEFADGYPLRLVVSDPFVKLNPDLYSAWGQTLLFASSYTYKYESQIEPLLHDENIVLVDRFYDTVFALHSLLLEEWNGISREESERWIGEIFSPLPQPDLTFFLSAKVSDLQARWAERGTHYSDEYQQYLERVEARYESQLSKFPERVVTLDASLNLSENLAICESHIQKLLTQS